MTDPKNPPMFDAVRDQLKLLGYTGELLRPSYSFRDFLTPSTSSRSSVRTIELAAFARFPPSLNNACFGVTIPADDSPKSITPYSALGAPQILALHPQGDYIRRWKMGANGDPQSLGEFRYDQIASTFDYYREEWNPQRILDARTLPEAQAQLDFFDAGFLPALEATLQPKIKRNIKRIMDVCKAVYARQHPNEDFDAVLDSVFRLVFRLIAAKMLIDRNYKPEWMKLDAQSVVAAVNAFYFSGETPDPVLQDSAVQVAAWRQVRQGLDLQNLSVETLAYLYENAFITEKLRRDQSIYATPPEVAEYVVRQLPIKELPYMERRVFEPFTGAAPFLTASLRRLRELMPKDISPVERHEYFINMLSGIENEPFAREIARYALILADYPNRDSWHISGQDAYTGSEFNRLLQNANIVLCNPPYGKLTTSHREDIGDNAAYSKEVQALHQVVSERPAMFGFVLPRAFLDRRDFRSLRQNIAEHYKSVSVTILPEKTFNIASQEVALVTAHNVDLANPPYSYAVVTSKGYNAFRRMGEPTWRDSYSELLRRNDDIILWRTPLQSVWEALMNYDKFDALAEIHSGIRYHAGKINECVVDDSAPGYRDGISTVNGYLEAYIVCDYQYMSTDVTMMHRRRERIDWNVPKVLVNSFRTSRGYWSIAGAIDEEGLLASAQFCGIWPKKNTPIELLAALISGPIANAFIFSNRTSRRNQIQTLKQIPVPTFTTEQTELIVSLVQDYYSQRGQWLASEELDEHFQGRCLELLYQIDAAVLEAYAIPAEVERELLRQFEGAERRPLPFKFPGYGAEYERAKAKLQAEKAYRAVLKQYHALVDKTFLSGITEVESETKERLRQQIDAFNAPFYVPIFKAMGIEN